MQQECAVASDQLFEQEMRRTNFARGVLIGWSIVIGIGFGGLVCRTER